MEVLWHKAWEFILKCVSFILNFFKRNPLMHLWWCLHATAKKIEKELKGVDLNVHAHVHPSVRKIHSLFSHPRNNRSLSTYAQFRLPLCYIVYTSTIMHTLHLYFLMLCDLCDRFGLRSIMHVLIVQQKASDFVILTALLCLFLIFLCGFLTGW